MRLQVIFGITLDFHGPETLVAAAQPHHHLRLHAPSLLSNFWTPRRQQGWVLAPVGAYSPGKGPPALGGSVTEWWVLPQSRHCPDAALRSIKPMLPR